MSSSLLPATLTPLGEGWLEEWALTMPDGFVHTVTRTAALARIPLHPVVTDDDLCDRFRGLSALRTGSVGSYQAELDEAWKQIVARLVREGRLPYLVRTPDALREAHAELALALIFEGFGVSAEGEHWRTMARERRAAYDAAYKGMTVQLDVDQDGRVDDPSARQRGAGAVASNAAPDRHRARALTRYF